jgi:hypothetical protein
VGTENTDDLESLMIQPESSPDDFNTNKVVAEIELSIYSQFQAAAFQRYKDSVFAYSTKVWREARSVALQRDPDATVIEITKPDVEIATVRTEMKLMRLRQLRFPFRLIQQFVTLVTGIIAKVAYDSAHVQTGEPGKDFLFLVYCLPLMHSNYLSP